MVHHDLEPAHRPDPPTGDPVAAQLRAARLQAHHGPAATGPRHGTALCLSGGGFRAALFHLGALRRLDELGVLGSLRTVSAVSGGALVANLLTDPRLEWPDPAQSGRVGGFDELVARPLRALTGRNVRTPVMLSRLHPRWWRREEGAGSPLADRLAAAVPEWEEDLRELHRDGPVVLTGATEVGYGVSWLFADAASAPPRGRIGDHRLGWSAPPPG
ncbi:patatin-like phospholipase family protein, partial [Ornithinicoccus halotolerans]|uniref:patatin-like phospholipase family protein n=1 Tax=Ornithinicoccus halotolerans TaxID=1748220 RepID=UPI001E55425F